MIPKIIHYIWLGGKPLPKLIEKCMASWKKFCPDYEIKRWDESNLDLKLCPFIEQSLDAKKYAFAADVFRFEILKNEGGIYLDVDVELLKPLDDLLNLSCFTGFENANYVAPGLIMAAEKGHPFIKEMCELYYKQKFDLSNISNITVCILVTDLLKKHGLKCNNQTQKLSNNIDVFSTEYFCPKSLTDGKTHITKNTYSIHHYYGSWVSPFKKFTSRIMQIIKRIIGEKNVEKIRERKRQKQLKKENRANEKR